MKTLIAIVTLFAATATAGAQVNFDQGVDLKSFKEQAASAVVEIPETGRGIPAYTNRDCKEVEFTAGSPLTSPDMTLRSMTIVQDCYPAGYPAGQTCTIRPEYYTRTTRVIITEPRVLKPGQKEVFKVCLSGGFLSIKTVESVYKYKSKVRRKGIFLTPKGPLAQEKSAEKGCRLALDAGYTCSYKCDDGTYFTQFNPLYSIPSPTQWGPEISIPCRLFSKPHPATDLKK